MKYILIVIILLFLYLYNGTLCYIQNNGNVKEIIKISEEIDNSHLDPWGLGAARQVLGQN